ncbi:GNAT family N-acetyltransferase [Roseateles albus]|uniref:GNAT family N-acetyltransferase n=1 Tax=Roseateles albus TaxID=2987525 RepID=A0ABT5K9C9_9BURK|nr:GNAT family N-acetyltransferase [Roseateles albus]MDC8770562.1 GNAT family N-acetyltransferase [Roseateles albus]
MQHRCTLDKFRARDASSLYRLLVDPAVRTFLGGPVEPSLALERVRAQLENNSDLPAWAIRPLSAEPNQLAGVVSLDSHHDGFDVELSYALLPEYQGLGYAADAARLALNHAFEVMRLHRVVAETQTANGRSVLLLARVGMSCLKTTIRFGAPQSIFVMNNPMTQDSRCAVS